MVTYLGVFVLALATQGRDGLRRTIAATGAAIAVIGIVALASRLHPDWFQSAVDDARQLPSSKTRLNYPLGYWNGLGALMAMGIPLLLVMSLRARSIVGRVLAAAVVPVLALVAFYTLSRGAAIEVGIALAVLLALYPRRLAALPTLSVLVAGSALLVAAAAQRDALEDGLFTGLADQQRDEMIAIVLVVCAGVAMLQAAIALAGRYDLGPRPRISRTDTRRIALVAAVVAVVVAVAAGVPGELGDRWEDFKQPGTPTAETDSAARFASSDGSGRYQAWQAAIDADQTAPLTGIGPGTFEFWWARNGSIPGFFRDAHSLYLEVLGELGIIGLLLVIGLVGGVLVVAVRRSLRASEEKRALLAAAAAACAAFSFAAAIDWVWELAVLPCTFLLLAAGIAGPMVVRKRIDLSSADPRDRVASGRVLAGRFVRSKPAIALTALLALIAVLIPYAGASALSKSQDLVQATDLEGALEQARTAANIEPFAATPALQEALILEADGDLAGAAEAATQATEDEPTNWRTWLVLSRIQAYRGEARAAVYAYEEARSLNPRSRLFTDSR